MRKFKLLILALALTGFYANAQDKSYKVSVNLTDVPVSSFLKELEAITPFKFYFDPASVDSSRVNVNVSEAPLNQVLEQTLRNTGLHFSFSPGGEVFVTRGYRILTELPAGLFGKTGSAANDSLVDFGLNRQQATETNSENKLYVIGTPNGQLNKGVAVITGYLRNSKDGEPVVNAAVFVDQAGVSTTTDQYGKYSLSLPPGNHILNVQGIGMKDSRFPLLVHSDGQLDIVMNEQVTTLKEVVVSSQKVANINRVQMGVERISIERMRQLPTVFGETDVLRALVTLPGVKTVGEASTGFNVRGGSADQNLILFNDATIYNPSHFFGMFSAFNPDVIKDVELYKSSIPARFGGRLSSVLDITSREGNKKEFAGNAGLGLITSRVQLEGPLVKDRSSFIFGARTTYANWMLQFLPQEYKNSKASFQDVNLNLSHKLNEKSDLYFTGYFSNDRFALNSDTTYGYSNRNFSLKWKHAFSNQLTGTAVAGFDQYLFNVTSTENEVNAYKLGFSIDQLNFKSDLTYFINSAHSLDFGISSILYGLEPGSFKPEGKNSLVAEDVVAKEQALESGVYFSHRFNVNQKFSIHSGIRYSIYNYLGPQDINYYAPGLPVEEGNLVETISYGKGKFIETYHGPEYRLSLRYAVTPDFSIKAGFNSQRQYIHMLSNTTSIAPTDIWKLSDPNIRPQRGQQVSLGFYKNLKSNTIETSVEVYYKRIQDYLDYKPGAVLVLNHDIERDVINTTGKAYGVEVMIKKPGGKLNGWISYTYSRIMLVTDNPELGLVVNKGEYYPANYDKPHDVTVTGNFRINHRFSLSLNSTYSTGRPITLPIGRYYYGGSERVLYSDRNAYRIPDYFRTDFSMNIEGNHKVNQKTHNSWTIGFYNLFGRRNPYSVYFVSENGLVNGYKLSIFGSIIPFINYNIRF